MSEKRREFNMEEIYSLYIGYAPDCCTTTTSSSAAAATTCPPGTGKSRRKDELVENRVSRL